MASKLLKHLGIGVKKPPPPPKPDYNQLQSDSPVPQSPTSEGRSSGPSGSQLTLSSAVVEDAAPSSPHRPPPEKSGGLSPNRAPLPSTSSSAQEQDGQQQQDAEQGAVRGAGGGFPKLEDEYSDPIDLKSFQEEMAGTCVPPVMEDDYSVPYEVKKLFREMRLNSEGGDSDSPGRKGGMKSLRNYPYDEGAIGFSPSHRPLGPDSDTRSKLEYDDPWEWTQRKGCLLIEANNHNIPPTILTNQRPPLCLTKMTTPGSLDSEPDSDKLPHSMNVQYDPGPMTPSQKEEDSEEDADASYLNLQEWVPEAGAVPPAAEAAPAPPAATGDATAGPDKRVGNYEEPWDLNAKQKELEKELRAISDRASKVSSTAPGEQPAGDEAVPQGSQGAQAGPSPSSAAPAQATASQQASGGPDPRTADTRSQEGYEKPWDWKPHQKDDRSNIGYEKPWDWKPHEKDDRPPGEYDEPWDQQQKQEELAQNLMAAKNSSKEEDTRPPEEYEEPWDKKQAKKHDKSASHAGSSNDSSPKSSQSPVLAHAGQESPKKKHRGASLQLELGPRAWNLQGERVDYKIPLEQQGWYHGSISRVDAENLLRVHKEGSYLVRMSESNKLDYSLSLKSARGFMHMKIVNRDGKFILGQFSQPFASISLMIHHYSISKLPIKGAEHMSLLHPVINELL